MLNSFEDSPLKTPNFTANVPATPSIFAFFDCCYSQTAQIYQLFQTKLVVYGVVFDGLTHMLMSKNVNDFSKVSPKDQRM